MKLVRCPGCGIIISTRFSLAVHKSDCTEPGVVRFASKESQDRWNDRTMEEGEIEKKGVGKVGKVWEVE